MTMTTTTTPQTPESGSASTNPDPAAPPAANNGNGAGGGTFTQADVDRIAAEARTQGRSSTLTATLKEFGFEDLDTAKSFFAAAKKRQEDEMSELERTQARVGELEPAAQERDTLKAQHEERNKTITVLGETLIKDLNIPKYVEALLADMEPLQRLQYITDYRADFVRTNPTKPDIDAAGRGGGSQPKDKTALRAKYGIRS